MYVMYTQFSFYMAVPWYNIFILFAKPRVCTTLKMLKSTIWLPFSHHWQKFCCQKSIFCSINRPFVWRKCKEKKHLHFRWLHVLSSSPDSVFRASHHLTVLVWFMRDAVAMSFIKDVNVTKINKARLLSPQKLMRWFK